MLSRRNTIISMVMNLLITLATIGVVTSYFLGNDGEYNIPPSFRFFLFTTDSNVLCMLASLIMGCFELRYLTTGKQIPYIAVVMKYIGSTAVALTFVVVVLFLGPTTDFVTMVFGGTSVYMHFLGPVLGFLSFCFFENIYHISKKIIVAAVFPAVVYAVVYISMVVFIGHDNGGWIDFYGFNIGGFWYLSCAAIILVTTVLSALLRFLHNKNVKSLPLN